MYDAQYLDDDDDDDDAETHSKKLVAVNVSQIFFRLPLSIYFIYISHYTALCQSPSQSLWMYMYNIHTNIFRLAGNIDEADNVAMYYS